MACGKIPISASKCPVCFKTWTKCPCQAKPACFICLKSEGADLFRGCACEGAVGFVHITCVEDCSKCPSCDTQILGANDLLCKAAANAHTGGEECCICLERMPGDPEFVVMLSCCAQNVCKQCEEQAFAFGIQDCPLCRCPYPKNRQEEMQSTLRNAARGRPGALREIGVAVVLLDPCDNMCATSV